MSSGEFREEDFEDLIRYYDQTQFDYRVAWLNQENLAVHFGFYDEKVTRHADALSNTNQILADKANITDGERILDAGCGQGGSCIWLAKHKKVEVVGISPVKSQIEHCRINAQKVGLTNRLQFFQADYCRTHFESGSFDVIWACESVCHTKEKADFYNEAYRLLRPGGRLIMAEYVRKHRNLPGKEEQLLLSWLNRWAIPDIDSTKEHQQKAKAAGFQDLQIKDYTHYTWISLKNLHKISRRWIWLGYPLRWLGIRSKVQHDNHVGGIRQFRALQKGLWYYGVIVGRKE